MKTIKLPIRTSKEGKQFVSDKQSAFSYAFRNLYKRLEESPDTDFQKQFKQKFNVNDIEYRSLLSEVKSFKEREIKHQKKHYSKVEELSKTLFYESNPTRRYKLFRSLSYFQRQMGKETVFGGRELLRKLTKESNKDVRDENRLVVLKEEYRQKRIMPLCIMGEANQHSNRFFDFKGLAEGICVYKPQRGIRIELNVGKGVVRRYRNELMLLQLAAQSNLLPIYVKLTSEYLWLTYDEEKLNGFGVDEISLRKEVGEIKKEGHQEEYQKQLIKDCYKKYYDEQRERKQKGKITNRCISIDMNPDNIGYSVLDKTEDNVKVISCGCFDMSWYFRKYGFSSNDARQKHINFKKKYELTIILKKLFNIARHYKVSKFIIEQLNIRDKVTDNNPHETNRKNKNLWCRGLITQIINRRCNETGIELIEVNPCYTSFIGNIQHPFKDSASASIEIGRRGLLKYTKGMFYPHITEEDIDTLEAVYGSDAQCSTDSSWVEIYKSLRETFGNQEFQCRFRTENVHCKCRSFSVSSYRSRNKLLIFNYL